MTVLAKIQRHPPLEGWDFRLAEVHLAANRESLHREPGPRRLPVIGGRAIMAFELKREMVEHYVDADDADTKLSQHTKIRRHEHYRLAFRDIARKTDRRTLTATIIPPRHLCTHSVAVEDVPTRHSASARIYVLALLNSFIVDYALRDLMSAGVHILSSVRRLHLPDLQPALARSLDSIVERAARLLSGPEYDALIAPRLRQTDPLTTSARTRLHAELDGLLAHLVGLTEGEFVAVLNSFPLVPEPVRVAAHNAYRDAERGLLT